VFGMILGILDASIVVPTGIVATPRIADPPRRTIILLDSDFTGSGIGAFGGIYYENRLRYLCKFTT
jgi:hypothetical protein